MERKTRVQLLKRKRLKRSLITAASILVFVFLCYAFILLGGMIVADRDKMILDETSVIETDDGKVIAEIYNENRKYIPIDEIPDHVIDAYIAIEDRRFYEHGGVDFQSVVRAVYKDIIAMSKVEGASTITQQLAKNLFLYNDKTWSRKTKEVMAALYLEQKLTKSEILELYLNEIYFGSGVYGIETAANYYYSKSAAELSIAEGAMLAGLAKAPNGYSPIHYPDKALARRNLVLAAMESTGVITAEEKQAEQEKPLDLKITKKKRDPVTDSYIDLVIKEFQNKHQIPVDQLRKGGYRIVVALDEEVQKSAYNKFQNDDYFPGNQPGAEGAFVMMNKETGEIIAAIGGRNYQLGNLNRVTVKRQPGSTFKPLAVYGPALMQSDKYNAFSLLPDTKIANKSYSVANVDNSYSQVVSIYEGLVESKNVGAVWLLDQIGIPYAKEYLEKMGMTIEDDGLAIALGGLAEGVTPLEIANGYRTFASGGKGVEAYTIKAVYDRDDELIFQEEAEEYEVFSEQVAWDMTEMLSKAVASGPGDAGKFSKALAGKTGTTEHPHVAGKVKDAWFAGFTPQYAFAIWMGFDRSDKDHYLEGGSSYPTRLAKDILTEMDQIEPLEKTFAKPDDVKALPKPIDLHPVTNVRAKYEFGGVSLVRGKITWDGLDDDRVIYRIYEERKGIDRRIGEVEGKNEFMIDNVLFKRNKYYVVAYDPLTKLESLKSESVSLDS